MRLSQSLLLLSLPVFAISQTFDLSSLLSEAQSVYTEATSILGGGSPSSSSSSSASTTSSTSSSTSSSSTSSSSSSSTTASSTSLSSSISTTSSLTSSPQSTPASASASQTAASQNSTASSSNHSTNVLAIVLGCTLGALAVAVFLLGLCFLCRRRRRNKSETTKHRSTTVAEDDSDVWVQHEKPKRESFRGPTDSLARDGVATAPLMSEHRGPYSGLHQNPFVPLPPPSRRSASRAGLHDHEPYSVHPDHDPRYGSDALAAGVGGAALGGLAAHALHHHDKDEHAGRGYLPYSSKDAVRPDHDPRSGADALAAGAGGAALGGLAAHHHDHDKDAGRGYLPYSNKDAVHPDHDPHSGSDALAAGIGGAALGGLAAHTARHHDHDKGVGGGYAPFIHKDHGGLTEDERTTLVQTPASHRRSDSSNRTGTKEPWPFYDAQPRRSTESSRSRRASASRAQDIFMTPDETPPEPTPGVSHPVRDAALGGLAGAGLATALRGPRHRDPTSRRKGILKQTLSDDSAPSSLSQDSSKDTSRSDEHIGSARVHDPGPHELGTGNIPPSPTHKRRSQSALGTAAPIAALGSIYTGEHAAHSERARTSTDSALRHSQDIRRVDTPPDVPSRSPHRVSLTPNARYSLDNNGTAELPTEIPPVHQHGFPQREAEPSPEIDEPMSPVSPITASQAGTLTNSDLQLLAASRNPGGVDPAAHGAQTHEHSHLGQGTTAVDSEEASKISDQNNSEKSGLLSAIRGIFSSQQAVWTADEEAARPGRHRSRNRFSWEDPQHDDIPEQSPQAGPVSSIAWQRPTPVAPEATGRDSHYGVLDRVSGSSSEEDAARNGLDAVNDYRMAEHPGNQHIPEDFSHAPPARRSAEARLSTDSHRNELTLVPSNTSQGRGRGYSGYGIGSGDPFDLARTRTDSQMTGVSLSNYREPTLAELKEQVQAEDRERERQSWRHYRSSSAGLRYGDDRNMFDLASESVAAPGIEEYDQFYGGDGRYPRRHSHSRNRTSGGSVGRAY